MKRSINNVDDLTANEIDELIEWATESGRFKLITNDDEGYDILEDMLNESYDELKIGYLTYSAGYVLRRIDPIAFDVAFWDYFDNNHLGFDSCFVVTLNNESVSFDELWNAYIEDSLNLLT